MNKAQRQPEDLVGKTVTFIIPGHAKGRRSRLGGFRTGKVLSVENGPRIGFRKVRVKTPSPGRLKRYIPSPSCIDVLPAEIQGVIWFGKVRPLDQWMGGEA